MRDDLFQDITIYHNKSERYNLRASVRNTSIYNRNRAGSGASITDSTLIRIFDINGYGDTWNVEKGDIIVLKNVSDEIIKAPLTELKQKYGKENVIEVASIDKNIYDAPELRQINHIKIGGR